MEYPYFKGLEADRYSFYRVPKALVKADLFQKMSGDAKLLYAVLLDRMSLSIKNGWQDKHGNAYIICTIRWKLTVCVQMEHRTPAAFCMRRHIVQHGPWATTKLLPTFWTRRMAAP